MFNIKQKISERFSAVRKLKEPSKEPETQVYTTELVKEESPTAEEPKPPEDIRVRVTLRIHLKDTIVNGPTGIDYETYYAPDSEDYKLPAEIQQFLEWFSSEDEGNFVFGKLAFGLSFKTRRASTIFGVTRSAISSFNIDGHAYYNGK